MAAGAPKSKIGASKEAHAVSDPDQSPFCQIACKGPWQNDQIVEAAERKSQQNAEEIAHGLRGNAKSCHVMGGLRE